MHSSLICRESINDEALLNKVKPKCKYNTCTDWFMNFLKQSQSIYKLKTVKKGGWMEKVLLIMHSTTSLWTVPRLYIQLSIIKDTHVHLQVQSWKPRTMAAPRVFTNDKENSALCTPAPPSSWWLETVISSEVQIHYSEHMHPHAHGHTFTLNKATLRILHCRPFSTVLHALIDPITGQRSQDSPILPQYTMGPPPPRFSPSSQHFPHSFILLSSHPSAQLSSLTSSHLNGYWLCSQSFPSLSVSITNVSANHRLMLFV